MKLVPLRGIYFVLGALALVAIGCGPPPPMAVPPMPIVVVPVPPIQAPAALNLSYIPTGFQAAVVLHPRRILRSDLFAGLPTGKGQFLERVDPRDFEQVIWLLRERGDYTRDRMPVMILRLATPLNAHTFLAQLVKDEDKITSGEYRGQAYSKVYQGPPGEEERVGYLACCGIDAQTLLLGPEKIVHEMQVSRNTASPLREQLALVKPNVDLALAFSLEQSDPDVELFGMDLLPQDIRDSIRLAKAGRISVNLTREPLLAATLVGFDDAGGQRLEVSLRELATNLERQGREFAVALFAQTPDILERVQAFTGDVFKTVTIERTGSEVQVQASNPGLPQELEQFVKVTIGEFLPALWDRRNQLKMVGLAMHNYFDLFEELPVARGVPAFDENGKSLLSWRVHLLPFYPEEIEYYDRLNRDERADGPQNKPIVRTTPKCYAAAAKGVPAGHTRIARLSGPGTAFPDRKMGLADMVDGTSNTILAIELPANKSIPWTSIDDIVFDPQKPLHGIEPIPAEGLLALFADGSVRTLRSDIPPEVFRSLVDPADGETIDPAKAFK